MFPCYFPKVNNFDRKLKARIDFLGCSTTIPYEFFQFYIVLYNALRHLSKIFNLALLSDSANSFFHGLEVGKIGRKGASNTRPNVEQMWERKFEINMSNSWILPFQVTKETRIVTLQWKILHNIYPTSILLEKIKIKSSAQCEHCKVLDTIVHFFMTVCL